MRRDADAVTALHQTPFQNEELGIDGETVSSLEAHTSYSSRIWFLPFNCVCVYHGGVGTGACGGQKKDSDALEMEFQAVVNYLS